ncbi:MAG: peptidoglycan-binding protein [Clostridia bacterium]
MRRLLFLGLASVLLLAPGFARAQALPEAAVLRADTQVYADTEKARALGELEAGTRIEVVSVEGAWVKIRYLLKDGYVALDRIAPATDDRANVGAGPTLLGRTVYVTCETTLQNALGEPVKLAVGDQVTLLGIMGERAEVMRKGHSGTVPIASLAVDQALLYGLGLPGDSIEALQTRLESLGYFDGVPDGVFSVETADAVLRFRAEAGLTDAFQIDAAFEKALNAADAPASPIRERTLRIGDTGGAVKRLQARLVAKTYLVDTPRGHYDSLTAQAVRLYQSMEGLAETGTATPQTLARLFSSEARKLPRNLIPASRETAQYLPGGVVNVDWWTSGIQQIFAKGTVAQITDIATGLSWYEVRRGGSSHADVQPLTEGDTANFQAAVGGKWNWSRRAIWVTVEGVRYAASMNCMPHGNGAIADNNFPGHHCVHFLNSRTHGGDNLDEAHQMCVNVAANTDYVTAGSVDWQALYAPDAEAAPDAETPGTAVPGYAHAGD